MKPIKPTKRDNKRYIKVDFIKSGSSDPKKWAEEKLRRILGSWGTSMAGIKIISSHPLILEVRREWVYIVRGALTIGEEPFLPITKVSGTLKGIKDL